ncbi:AAA family ATPase (macronuclear) [Tetrahymena thermophila SB210]|uniref:AAA family ATPase n=1 Tax=Tetrahymena thermophila (strain SB210) TaxID=312017 RepID=I7MD38_TETTS|nr:AAA family ATPase [Tetrahymena thermophila SB210]EAR85439.1 AAA family ATPase [Tetrahymena thermophila SB210]|eukprot:XP_001033102.1 AAA family ATPase [Tetrahymena thermophila SB210]
MNIQNFKRKECIASQKRELEEENISNKKKKKDQSFLSKINAVTHQEEFHSESSTMDVYPFQQLKQEKLQSMDKLESLNESGTSSPCLSNKKIDQSPQQCENDTQNTQSKNNNQNKDQNIEEEDLDYQRINKPQEIFDCKYKPSLINFRDKEKNEIKNFLQRCIDNKQKTKCLLITGMPGCGKTLTTTSLLEELSVKQKKFEYIKFNAMSYNNQESFLRDLHFKIFKSRMQSSCQDLLTQIKQSKRSSHLTIFIDEFDNLFHGSSQDIFILFNIASLEKANISIIGVSNSMEMVFDLSKKYKIILPDIKNLVFEPYSQKEIYQIIQSRLKEMSEKLNVPQDIIDDKALRLCSGKMYNLKGGDIRCLFDVCKKALEESKKGRQQEDNKDTDEQNNDNLNELQKITIPQLNQIIDKLYKVSYKFIAKMPIEQILTILSIYSIIKQKEGIVEISVIQVKNQLNNICNSMGIQVSEISKLKEILENLQSYQILQIRNKENSAQNANKRGQNNKNIENMTIFLKITTEDVEDALSEESKFSDFFEQYIK